jgi:FKBP-type peptidyl-prolyl cis-trans isomerase
MVFWGEVVGGNKTTLVVPEGGSKYLLQVCLENPSTTKGLTSLYVQPNNGEKGFLICHLGLNQSQFSICHELVYEDSPLTFWTTGGGVVHITGTVQEEERSDDGGSEDDEEEEPYAEECAPTLVKVNDSAKRARSNEDTITDQKTKKIKTVPTGAEVAADVAIPQTHQQRKKWKIKPQNDEGVLVVEPKSIKKASGVAVADYIIGKGAEPKLGATVKITYEGSYPDGTVFDQRITRGKPFAFRLGTAQVIRGLDLGMEGMRVGGSREIIIPPELG